VVHPPDPQQLKLGDGDLPRTYSVLRAARQPLLSFILRALEADGCTILNHSGAGQAPFRIALETATGERMGIIAYAFFAGCNAGTLVARTTSTASR
jgi:hypothetical protein